MIPADGQRWHVEQADCLAFMARLPADSVDLCLFSPPYERARTYLENGEDLGIARDTDEWVSWMVEVFAACRRVCTGLVACVCEGQTRNYRWSAGPALLMADLHRAGFNLRRPVIYHRVGIPGSGGPDWLRADCEYVICTTREGKLPWSDNTACGHRPKYGPGGEMSYRQTNGARVNEWGMTDYDCSGNSRKQDGTRKPRAGKRRVKTGAANGQANGDTLQNGEYSPPVLANPGNVIHDASDFLHCKVGGALMGNALAHANEAPFPEKLARFFVRSFCPPDGITLDCFAGSGTTLAVALAEGRRALGCDLRPSQVDLTRKRCGGETPTLFP